MQRYLLGEAGFPTDVILSVTACADSGSPGSRGYLPQSNSFLWGGTS
jgi:hypothetical protein